LMMIGMALQIEQQPAAQAQIAPSRNAFAHSYCQLVRVVVSNR
jgi:hypothetical protein